jgi:Domain of unknown function (DUF4214)/Putative binding domain, N-terminal
MALPNRAAAWLAILFGSAALHAQTLSVTVSSIPASATRVVAIADQGTAATIFTAGETIAPGTAACALTLNVPAGAGYRVRAFADNSTGLLRSGEASGLTALPGQSTPVSISIADIAASLSPSNPASAALGSSIAIQFTVTDPGDIVENQQASLYISLTPFELPNASLAATAPLIRQGASYTAAFSIHTPISGAVFYYACRLNMSFADQNTTLTLPAGSQAIALSGPANIGLTITNIPAAATAIGVLVDGGGLTNPLQGIEPIATNTSAATMFIGVPSGSSYRVRVFASSSAGLLRSGALSAVAAPSSGSNAVSIALSGVVVTTDPSTPTQAASGSTAQLRFNIADPGDIIENGNAELFCAGAPFASPMEAPGCGAGVLAKVGAGLYTLTFQAALQIAQPSYNYAWRLYCGSGLANINLDSPPGGANASQAILLTGSQLVIAIGNIPATATSVTGLLDGGGHSLLRASQTIPAGTTSASLTLTVPAGSGYRARAYAWDAGGVLRSGQAALVNVPAGGSANVGVTLSDVVVVTDAATPVSLAASSESSFVFDITDPGDVIEGQPAILYYGTNSFSLPAGIGLAGTLPQKVAGGSYTVSFWTGLPAAGDTFFYALRIMLPDTAVDFPAAGTPAWQIALGVSCTYSIQPPSISAPASGATGVLSITASAPQCPWNAQASAPWLSFDGGGQGAGSGPASYSIAANASGARSASLDAGTAVVNVSQPAQTGACSYSLGSPAAVLAEPGSYAAQVTAPDGCPWAAASSASWIGISGGASGSGNGSFTYTVDQNTGDLRTGNITVAGETLVVNQHAAYSSDAGFVRQLYNDLLQRDPDADGLTYWSGILSSGAMSRASVAASFFESQEFSEYGLYVIKLYVAVLARFPDVPGFTYWVSVLGSGASQSDLAEMFVNTPEFFNRFGDPDNSTFVTLLYQNVLGRDPDPTGLSYWTSMLDQAMTRPQLVYSFVQSQEFDNNIRTQAYAFLLYAGFLARSPDTAGFSYWCGVLANTPLATVVSEFITSPEYIGRF